MLVTKTINMNMKFRKYPEAGPILKEPNASLPDIASRACSMYPIKVDAMKVFAVQRRCREVDEVVVRNEQSRRCAPQKLDRPQFGAQSRRGRNFGGLLF